VGPGPGPDFDYDNLNAEKSFHPTVAYRNSKLANVWFVRELARRLKGKDVAVLAVNPGWVPATIAETQASPLQRFLFRRVYPLFPFTRTVDQAADNTVYAATDPALQAQSGGYFEDQHPGIVSDEAQDDAKARRDCGRPPAAGAASTRSGRGGAGKGRSGRARALAALLASAAPAPAPAAPTRPVHRGPRVAGGVPCEAAAAGAARFEASEVLGGSSSRRSPLAECARTEPDMLVAGMCIRPWS
jgi:NAD(P)-dependent dehydrogenase (short-subunit alcohol dehydrogenase family)